MVIGVLRINIRIPGSISLKDKRRHIKSIKDRVRDSFNVSVSEIGSVNNRRQAVLGIACINNDTHYAHSILNKIVELVRKVKDIYIDEFEIEMI